MVYQRPRQSKPMDRTLWFSKQAGFSAGLSNLLTDYFDTEISPESEEKIVKGIKNNYFWCLPCASAGAPEEVFVNVYRLVYTILETCRKYGTSIAVFPSIGLKAIATSKHPWIDSGNYFDALLSVDIAVIEGEYPDRREHKDDWTILQTALSQRATKLNKPTLLLDKKFCELPIIANSKAAQNYLKSEEDTDAAT